MPVRTAHHRHRLVPGRRHAAEEHQGHEVAHVQAVGRGVESGIDAAARRGQPVPQRRRIGALVDQPTGFEVGKQVCRSCSPPQVVVGERMRPAGELRSGRAWAPARRAAGLHAT